jgi:hypothetical protein
LPPIFTGVVLSLFHPNDEYIGGVIVSNPLSTGLFMMLIAEWVTYLLVAKMLSWTVGILLASIVVNKYSWPKPAASEVVDVA